MSKITKGLAALAVAAALTLSGCASGAVEKERAPIAVESSIAPAPEAPIEEGGDGPYAEANQKIAVAGKESFTYDDGLAVSIGNIRRDRVPGDFNDHPGAPMVRFDVRITNNSPYKVDADEASVALSYGQDGREGHSVYVEDEDDLSGIVAKGRKKTGTYSFEVPAKYMKDLFIEVSPDYSRDPALFSASA